MDNWIKWNRKESDMENERPKRLKLFDRVEILMRSGYKNEGFSDAFHWGNCDDKGLEIIFYRVTERSK